jgi:hypothetical protein
MRIIILVLSPVTYMEEINTFIGVRSTILQYIQKVGSKAAYSSLSSSPSQVKEEIVRD